MSKRLCMPNWNQPEVLKEVRRRQRRRVERRCTSTWRHIATELGRVHAVTLQGIGRSCTWKNGTSTPARYEASNSLRSHKMTPQERADAVTAGIVRDLRALDPAFRARVEERARSIAESIPSNS